MADMVGKGEIPAAIALLKNVKVLIVELVHLAKLLFVPLYVVCDM